jgi:hypothetical protein
MLLIEEKTCPADCPGRRSAWYASLRDLGDLPGIKIPPLKPCPLGKAFCSPWTPGRVRPASPDHCSG